MTYDEPTAAEATSTSEATSTAEPTPEARDIGADATVAGVRRDAARAIGHRARTPLSLVIGPIHSTLQHATVDPGLRHDLEIALDQARLVREALDELVEIGSWLDVLDTRPTRLGDIVAEVGTAHLSAASWRGITYDVAADDTRLVSVDRNRVMWAMGVLVRAMVDAVDPGGHVDLRCVDADDHVEVTLDVRGARLVSTVARPEMRVADAVVRLHGASVVRRTGEESSSLVCRWPVSGVTAPVAQAPSALSATAPLDGPPTIVGPDGAPVVLLVEDDETLTGYLTRSLSVGYRVMAATSAENALVCIDHEPPDLVVCDLLLPGDDGEQLVRRLRSERSDVPIIVVSGRVDERHRIGMLRDGIDDYLTKPFAVEELSARIANLLAAHDDLDGLRNRVERAHEVAAQLQHALDSRVVIEQAKAFVAADRQIGVEEAFDVLRRHARSQNRKLHEVATEVVAGFRP